MGHGAAAPPQLLRKLLQLLLVLLDQYSKNLASAALDYGRPLQVFSWFNLTLQHNTGAAFSFLSDAGGWQRYFFTAVAAVISIGLVIWLYLLPRGQWLLAANASGTLRDILAVYYR